MVTPAADAPERAALVAAQRLKQGEPQLAAWLALWSLERNPRCGLAWATLARMVLEVNQDPLATLTTRFALEMEMPDPYRGEIGRFHRIDLWSRGLLASKRGAAILQVSAFDDAEAFEPTGRFEAWVAEETKPWGGLEGAAQAVRRIAAALADAWAVPETQDNPLRAEAPWALTEVYETWCDAGVAKELDAEDWEAEAQADDLTVLSDYWIEQEVIGLGASGQFDLALERAELWAQLRPERVRPLAVLARIHHAADRPETRDQVVQTIVAAGSKDLNELEEARVALGEMELWQAQVAVLDQMEALTPQHPVVRANRGVAYLQLGEIEKGTKDLEIALEADPNNGPALANLGLVRMRQDEYVAARELLERAVAIAPDQPQVRVYLAACKNNQDDRGGAMEELRAALQLDPENTQARQLLDELEGPGTTD